MRIIIIMEIYAAPELMKYTTALGAYNIKSFTYEINQHTLTPCDKAVYQQQ